MGTSEDFMVVTVTFTEVGAPVVNCTGFVTVHTVAAGAPEQFMFTGPV